MELENSEKKVVVMIVTFLGQLTHPRGLRISSDVGYSGTNIRRKELSTSSCFT